MELQKEIARALKAQRIKQGISTEQMAEIIGVKQPDVSSIESGRRNMTLRKIKQYADGLGCVIKMKIVKSRAR